MKKQHSAEFLRNRKFLMVLPLLVLPFLTMAFWALGGGKGNRNLTAVQDAQKGFNTELPQAKFNPDEKQDKFSIYESSAKDTQETNGIYSQLAFSESGEGLTDPNEDRINEKLAQINSEINRQTSEGSPYSSGRSRTNGYSGNMGTDVNRLEDLMQNMQSGNGDDPEMRQLNTLLEKVLDIQHPGRAREKQKEASLNNAEGAYAVHLADGKETKQSLFSVAKDTNSKQSDYVANAIQAVIHQDQEIVSGSVVKLRLLDSIYVNGTLIPKNEFVYGIASVDAERLKIEIATLRHRNSILPVALSAYDMDGLEGLYIPGAITRDAAKSGVDDAIQSLQIMTMDPSVSAQVAGAGIQAAKGLFSRKAKQVKVKVKAGYQLLLRDNNQKNN
ncbi:Bacteroides conjugative transposon TraM protein [Daejeonella rubra]|uniref:Bacteroides conjugative transposon TraM protein n=1 Tax=Daejeonella rubra TaxID=990371 RepID=A0A1G9XNR5_9SPHI|nr:conjugative transposon protein TraM [Daejeonella rubra]SDM97815.1 Bacteroides conjugative transposon TraM protein [Daejeonella rubra]